MTIYTVHIPPDAVTPDQVAESAVFVKEGFAFFGFAFTGLWLLSQRLWLHAIGYFLVFMLTIALFWYFGPPRGVFGGVTLLYSIFIGIEGNEWVRRRYARLGWSHAGTVSGPSLDECERRFFQEWTAGDRAPRAVTVPQTAAAPQMPPAGQVLGVFPASRFKA